MVGARYGIAYLMMSVMRVDVETSERDEAVHAIEQVFGFRTAFTGRSMTFQQHSLIGPGIAFSQLHFGGTMTVEVDPIDDVVIGEVPSGRYDLGLGPGSREVTGNGLFIPRSTPSCGSTFNVRRPSPTRSRESSCAGSHRNCLPTSPPAWT
jgi:hypothetical protein